jgi:TolB protein
MVTLMEKMEERTLGERLQTNLIVVVLISFVSSILLVSFYRLPEPADAFSGLPAIMFLNWDDADRIQLFFTGVRSSDSVQLTQSPTDILEFAISPQGNIIAFVTRQENGGTTLYLLDWNGRIATNQRQILACPETTCNRLVWAPDGRRLIYERRPLATPNVPVLWWLDTQTGETVTVLEDAGEASASASLSPDGQWLAYASPRNERLVVYHFGDGRHFELPNTLGSTAVWHPDSTRFLINDQDLVILHGDEGEDHEQHTHEYQEAIHLFAVDVSTQERTTLNQAGNVDNGNAAWSPDGAWIAFGRKLIRTPTGRQLWLMRPDGSEARPLTDNLVIHHGPPHWSPDGRYLLFQQVNTSETDRRPTIWLMNIHSGERLQIVPSGTLPAWLPIS